VHHNILSLVSNQTITFNTSQINTFEIDDSMSTQLTLDKHLSRHIADASNDCTMIKTNALSIGHQIFISNLDRSSTQTSINLRVEPYALQWHSTIINLINRNQYIENNATTTV
jgi:hypothetical protein